METLVTRHAAAIDGALSALDRWFDPRSTRPAILVRRARSSPNPDDAALAQRLVSQFRAETRMDGSVRGDFAVTTWRAIELMDLDHGADNAGTVRVIGYLLARQDEPGAYGRDIVRREHGGRALPGFFSPGPADVRVAPVTLPNGLVITDETDARYALSCLALRAALKARHENRPQVRAHAESLADLAREWGGAMPLTLACSTLHGLALADPPMREMIPPLVGRIAEAQKDGTWKETEFFHALQALLAVHDAGATEAIGRAIPALIRMQGKDGGFAPDGPIGEERGWIAVRALQRARET